MKTENIINEFLNNKYQYIDIIERFIFFEPVFNLADLILFVGGVISFIGLVKIYKTGKKI